MPKTPAGESYLPTLFLLRVLIAAGLVLSLCESAFSAEPVGKVTFAESNIAIIRQTTLYRAAVGTGVHDGDIVETPDGGVQIELSPTTLMAVAAHSRVLIRMQNAASAGCDLLLINLNGMIKITRTLEVAKRSICMQAAQIHAALASGSAIQRFDGSAVALFAEKGELSVEDMTSTATAQVPIKVPAEHFAQWRSGQALKVLDRPTPEFLAAVPKSFQDELTPMAERVRDVKSEPSAQREVSYADIAEWLKAMPQHTEFVRQFRPRLKDPEFRRQIDAELGKSASWGPILHPPPPPPPDDARQPI
jgi:hypothetical protein